MAFNTVNADCGVPALVDSNITLSYSSTLDGSILILTCENEWILIVTCHSSGSWISNPAQFTCSPFTTVPSGEEISTPTYSINNNCRPVSVH